MIGPSVCCALIDNPTLLLGNSKERHTPLLSEQRLSVPIVFHKRTISSNNNNNNSNGSGSIGMVEEQGRLVQSNSSAPPSPIPTMPATTIQVSGAPASPLGPPMSSAPLSSSVGTGGGYVGVEMTDVAVATASSPRPDEKRGLTLDTTETKYVIITWPCHYCRMIDEF
jgi:hypothetical protein